MEEKQKMISMMKKSGVSLHYGSSKESPISVGFDKTLVIDEIDWIKIDLYSILSITKTEWDAVTI